MIRRPHLTANVVAGLELAFREPSKVGALWGALGLPESDDGLTAEQRLQLKRAARWVEHLSAWLRTRDEHEPADGSAVRTDRLSIIHAKAALLDEVMRPRPSTDHRDVSKRYTALEARKARASAGARR